MSLAPNEQRELTEIETSLRKSDPKLAAMMAAFNRVAFHGAQPRRERMSPWHPRLRRLIPIALATFVLGLFAIGFALLSHQPGSTPGTACGSAASTQVIPCQQAGSTGGHAHHMATRNASQVP